MQMRYFREIEPKNEDQEGNRLMSLFASTQEAYLKRPAEM